MKKKQLIFLSLIIFIASFLLFSCYFLIQSFYKIDITNNISTSDYKDNKFVLSINNLTNDIKCGFTNKNENSVYWTGTTKNNKCNLKVDENISKIYLKKYLFVREFNINNLIINDDLPSKIYLPLNDKTKINSNIKVIGDKKEVSYESLNNDILVVKGNEITGKKEGKTKIKITVNNNYFKEIDVEVTDLIVKRPKKFNNNKSNLKCNRYSKKEVDKLEEILSHKIQSVGGYGTRAAVVESIRFLMLDFPYQIEYFFENGRIDGGMHNADGEGRYYHKGLYLHEDKFKNLKYSYAGPAIWGCPLMNYEDYGTQYKKGTYKPNGLDCSGFVSWSILNGGYDPGDRGAGDNLEDTNEINDIGGEKVDTSVELFKSGKVKAGDLLGIWGHIAIVAGIDDENVYVAESLWTFGGPVINTYSFSEATDEFVQAVLLDDYYKKDGLYTNMW